MVGFARVRDRFAKRVVAVGDGPASNAHCISLVDALGQAHERLIVDGGEHLRSADGSTASHGTGRLVEVRHLMGVCAFLERRGRRGEQRGRGKV